MRICVLGAGVVGVATAYYLAGDGHEVTVVDGASAAGLETSFANGAQISACRMASAVRSGVRCGVDHIAR